MKKIISLVIALAMLTCVAFTVSAAPANLLNSGKGFEDGAGDCVRFDDGQTAECVMEVTTADAHSGTQSYAVGQRPTVDGMVINWISPSFDVTNILEVGKTYTFVAYAKLQPDVTAGNLRMIIRDKNLEDFFQPISGGEEGLETALSVDEWTQFLGTFEVPANMYDDGEAAILCFDIGAEPYFLDDVFIVEGDYYNDFVDEDITPDYFDSTGPITTKEPSATKAPDKDKEDTADVSTIAYAVAAISGLGALVIRKKK